MKELSDDELEEVSGGRYSPGKYKEEALAFLRAHMDTKIYNDIMKYGNGYRYPYVAAKIYLNADDWRKYIWIEHHGSQDGYPGL